MADNVTLNAGSGGDTIAADDVGGVKYQVVKLAVGADGAASLVANASPIPVSDAGGALTVDGTVAVSSITTDVVPGTGATSLGKAKDSAVGSTDTGVAALARLRYIAAHSSGSDGSYDTLDLTSWHELRTRDQRARDIQDCNDFNDFTALNSDTTTIADSANHVFGSGAVSFNKVNGAANTVFGAVSFAIANLDISEIFEDGAFVGTCLYLPSLTNVSYAFIRLGTDASNYNEWRWEVESLTAAQWMALRHPTSQPDSFAGNGWDSTDIQYGVVGIAMGAETNTLSGIIIDHVHFVGGRITDTTIDASVTSSVSTPNINLHRIGGSPTDANTGNASAGTQRVVLASDQPTVPVAGVAAENAAVSGNPVLTGGRYDSSARTLGNGDVGALALNASGQLLVEIAAGAGSGGTAAADDADFTAGTTSGTPVMGSYQSTPTAVTDGDMGIIGITADREVKVSVTSGGITGAVVDSVAGATDEGVLAVAVRDDALATLTPADGDYTQLRTNARGAQWVALDSTAAQTVTLAAGTATNEIVGDVAQDAAVAGNPVLVGGRASTATPTAMSADGDSVYHWLTRTGATVVDGAIVDDAAFTPGTSRVVPIAMQADETATDSVDEGDAGCPRITLDRKQIVTQYVHAAAGGHSPFRSLDCDETEDEVKASAGKLFWIHAMNLTAAVVYLKVYNNTAAGTTVGTTTPVHTFPVATLGDTNGAGFAINFGDAGESYSTGICFAGLTGIADADTTGVATNGLVVNAGFI